MFLVIKNILLKQQKQYFRKTNKFAIIFIRSLLSPIIGNISDYQLFLTKKIKIFDTF